MKDLVELCRRNAHYSGLLVDHTLFEHIDSHLKRSETCSLTDTALEHPEVAFLDSELDVLHIVEMLLESCPDGVELFIYLRHSLFERLEILVLLSLGSLVQRVRCTDTCNDILTLGIDKPLTVELVVTVGRVT